MARTIDEIYNAIIVEKELQTDLAPLLPNPETANTLLSELSSGSKVAVWRLWFRIVAWAIHAHEVVFDTHMAEITAFADTLIGGTKRWLHAQCFKFQLGDTLIYNSTTSRFTYSTVNTATQIIKRASVLEAGGQLRIKVAKEVSSVPTKLDVSELAAFQVYISQIKFAGTNVIVTSNDADELRIYFTVFYDPLLMTSTGALVSNGAVKPVEDAINNFISTLPFDGVLNTTELTDAVQKAVGVKDPILTSASARFGVNPFVPISREYTADAGYMKIDPSNPLSSTITYTAEPN
jgi:hypothetical protein